MAGSRRESIGNILQRIQGLLRSKAMKEEDRPIWYDVVRTFPPKPTPQPCVVRKILYPEDHIRMHFKKTFDDRAMMNLKDKGAKSVPGRFVDTYMEIHRQKVVPSSEIFDKTASMLKTQGLRLVTHAESASIEKTRREALSSKREVDKSSKTAENTVNVDDLFSDKT